MLDLLNRLYREYSMAPAPSPEQYRALADAAFVLGSAGVPSAMVREAYLQLELAFRKIGRPV